MADTLYFVCLWGLTPRAWLSIKPYRDGTEIGSVKWRGKPITVKIVTGTPVETNKEREKYPPDLYALLKSNLQKQVRRGRMGAVATAARMWELGQFEFLRRLVVIAGEDAEISTETVVVSWLMAAKTKGLVLTEDHRRWVLGYVRSLVTAKHCRWLEMKGNRPNYDPALEPMALLDSGHAQCEQLAGILFRMAYGGLSGDPPMISRCIDWLIQGDKQLPTLLVTRWDEPLPKLLISHAAIDHHIWSGLLAEIEAEHQEYSQDLIATVIWECSSSYNIRKSRTRTQEWRDCWKVIHPTFKELTKGYLTRILNKFGGL